MKSYIWLILLLLITLAVTSCVDANQSEPLPTSSPDIPAASATPNLTHTSEPEGAPTVTNTPVPTIEETVTPTSTPEATPRAQLHEVCLEILPSLPDDAGLSGQVVLRGEVIAGRGYVGIDSKLDLATGTLIPIEKPENDLLWQIHVSPDRTRLAYGVASYSVDSRKLAEWITIEDSAGHTITKIPLEIDLMDGFYWLDNQRIVIGINHLPRIFNITTGETISSSSWFSRSPGGFLIEHIFWDAYGIFDSQLELLLYVQYDRTMLLWDVENDQTLLDLHNEDNGFRIAGSAQPKWAGDDSQVVLSLSDDYSSPGYELFRLDRSGRLERLTYLGDLYDHVIIQEFSWSPDNRQIAFVYSYKNNSGGGAKWSETQLAVLDLETLEITNYCGLPGWLAWTDGPIWSMDGEQLLIGRVEADYEIRSTILVDLRRGYAAVIAEEVFPAGWMAAP